VPRSLISTFQASSLDDDAPPSSDVADSHDQYEHFHASEQCQYILKFLPKPLDRKIMVLRAIEGMKWDDIAAICGLTERSIRMHYEKAVKILSDCLLRESSLLGQSTQIQLH
jgi:DNA-directed RNA polymerase specialized sigma24 family protein